ncbi:hypothetical protein Q0590_32705 [Rhodocytophaga aerolata]|uniref:Alpha/beta hydrolase n=1 Tax=Rhodocytophaga aerolata TaxID=455078 RepID=A0ABT8RG49_9BACT|nr:hypothetical protein [Rhodocytophaga aerolata]MDO1451081.1 hypothetical protein [Rhodocytophaga aerolata]
MKLIKKSDLKEEKELVLNLIHIQEGSGEFLIEGGKSNKDRPIQVFYHRPKNYGAHSKILMVIPGAGRNADSYRDAWIEESEKYSLLILSPLYQESEYGFEDYHLCGLIKGSNLKNSIDYVEGTNIAKLDEEKVNFKFNPNSDEWIFNDFDRIFDLAVKALNSKQIKYDIFGHSAGGHILHRLALFQKSSKTNIILASNASFYTLPSFDYRFPFGLKDSSIDREALKNAFRRKLVVFLGELDNENETGGTLLRSKSADQQGFHRLARGNFFFKHAKEMAAAFDFEFNWQIKTIPGVGHNHQLMGDAAGKYLYENN